MHFAKEKIIPMKTSDEKILRDIQKINAISQNYNLSDRKEIDAIYRKLKRQGKYRFYTWIGNAFFEELKTKTSSAKYRRYAVFGIRQIEILAFLMAVLLLGIGAANRVKDYENKVLQEALGDMKTQGSADGMPKMSSLESAEDDMEGPDDGSIGDDPVLEEYQRLYGLNQDFVGWIKLEGTDIDYPVLQSRENPETYLTHNFFQKEDRSGAIFLDGVTNTYPKDKNIVLYGHNMSDGSMFGELKKYKDKSFYQKYPYFEFDTLYEKSMYQIGAVLVTDISDTGDFCYYDFYNYDEGSFQACVDFIAKNRLYDTGCQFMYGDSFVMLSTCNGHNTDSRLVVVGVEK